MMASRGTRPCQWSVAQLARAIRDGAVSPVEVAQDTLQRIRSVDPHINAFITVMEREVLEFASRAETSLAAGRDLPPLLGVPVGVKDVIYTAGTRTTMGSAHFDEYVPDFDATVIQRLSRAGAIIIGKLNAHQFCYGATGDRSSAGAVRNPHDLTKVSGGSSSGSAAAVAAGLCHASVGTDTAGSVRIPASCCGVVGMKPTFGRVSKHGVFPLAWTLDHVGPLTRTVEDNALLLNVLAGHDPRDPYSSSRAPEDFTRALRDGVAGTRIGVPSVFFFDYLDEEVAEHVHNAIGTFAQLGAKVCTVDIPGMDQALSAFRLTQTAEAYAVHRERIEAEPDRYDDEVLERLRSGEKLQAYEYVEAQKSRFATTASFTRALADVDIVVAPTIPVLPPNIDQREITFAGHSEHPRFPLTRLTTPASFAGIPSMSLPCGFSRSGLPIGLQLIGRPFDEATVYRFGNALEQAQDLDMAPAGLRSLFIG